MYILARFPEKLSFDWVHRLRARLVKDEIKHQDYRAAVQFGSIDKELERAAEIGISAATIFVIDPNVFVDEIVSKLLAEGAEPGIDFDRQEVINRAAEAIIADTPAYEINNLEIGLEMTDLAFRHGILSASPAARGVPLPADVLEKIGGTLRAAIRYAARSYSVFDLNEDEFFDGESGNEGFWEYRRDKLSNLRVARMLRTKRVFDTEDAKSLEVLRQTADGIQISYMPPGCSRVFLGEQDSCSADALQAADVAAGTAREILNHKGLRVLANTLRRVFINGINLQEALR